MPVFHAALDFLNKNVPAGFELVLVDDGSSDKTENEIHNLQRQFPSHLKVILHPKILGIGRALRSGYTNSNFENICAMPADGSFDINELVQFLEFDDSTIVSFYRDKIGKFNSLRNSLSHIHRKFISFFLGVQMRDVNWVKAFKNKEAKSFEWKLNSRWIESEICAKLIAKGCRVIEVASGYYPIVVKAGNSTSLLRVIQALKETLMIPFIVFFFKRKLR